jgi:hypothetical protein
LKEVTIPIVQGLMADLYNALEGNAQYAMRGRRGDQQIVVLVPDPPPKSPLPHLP